MAIGQLKIGGNLGVAALCLLMFSSSAAHAQLQVTEIMSNPVDDDAWEWIEVRNLGAAPVDLNGYIIDRLGDALPTMINPGVQGSLTPNTIIPAGGVAVLYDADVPIDAADYDDSKFRAAWGLSASVPLVGVTGGFGGGLTNDPGAAIGLWANEAAYNADVLDDGMGMYRVARFDNAALSIDFRTDSGFPAASNGVSITWNGNGSFQDGSQWAATESATTSIPITVPGSTNSTMDSGNPGILPPGTAPSGLWITEIMYDSRSAEPDWEWVEVYNKTGAAIDFGLTPYVFDDDDDSAKISANVTAGVIPNGGVAVLFDLSQISVSDLQAAWDPSGAVGTNFIGLDSWTGGLTNGGDRFALWPSLSAYQSEAVTSGSNNRTMANAVVSIGYDDESPSSNTGTVGTWPEPDGNASISLTDLSLVSNQNVSPTVGESWVLSVAGDGLGSFNASGIAGNITVHPGGDLGTPGSFGETPLIQADFNGDAFVDGRDFLIWQRNLGVGTTSSSGDANGSGTVDAADLAVWKAQFDDVPLLPAAAAAAVDAVPEPAAVLMAGLAIAAGGLGRRRRDAN
ncbi:MAG TPA: lamin tail domain-containing protein [Lacipirellula sp.]